MKEAMDARDALYVLPYWTSEFLGWARIGR